MKKRIFFNMNKILVLIPYSIVLPCIDGVVIAVQCTATFLRSIVLPEFLY
jgi:hypothetical protein